MLEIVLSISYKSRKLSVCASPNSDLILQGNMEIMLYNVVTSYCTVYILFIYSLPSHMQLNLKVLKSLERSNVSSCMSVFNTSIAHDSGYLAIIWNTRHGNISF